MCISVCQQRNNETMHSKNKHYSSIIDENELIPSTKGKKSEHKCEHKYGKKAIAAGIFLGLCIDTDIRRYIDRYDIIYLSADGFCRYLNIYRRRYMRYIGVFPHC